MRHPIPYHIAFTGSAVSLATLLTYMPSRTGAAPVRACSRIQLLRQTTVDVKWVYIPFHSSEELTPPDLDICRSEYAIDGATSEMWRTGSIGEGSLYRTVSVHTFSYFSISASAPPHLHLHLRVPQSLFVQETTITD